MGRIKSARAASLNTSRSALSRVVLDMPCPLKLGGLKFEVHQSAGALALVWRLPRLGDYARVFIPR